MWRIDGSSLQTASEQHNSEQGAALPDEAIVGALAAGASKQGAPLPPEPPEPDPLQGWLDSPAGRYVMSWEQARLDEAVADVFGLHALQCGGPLPDALRANRMPHRILASPPGAQPPRDGVSIVHVAQFDELPFDTGSLDLVVLPHGLEFTDAPHAVLREVDRVLRPEGRLIVTGFNPASLWGLRQAMPALVSRSLLPAQTRLIGLPRLRDWFKLLSFDIGSVQYGCFRPLVRTQSWLDRTRFMEAAGDRWWPICGAVYQVSAVKRVAGMRRVGRVRRRAVRGVVVAVPSAQCETGEARSEAVQRGRPPYM
jgi:SAM-dependent methyltransferase